jgi:hypothetical protein
MDVYRHCTRTRRRGPVLCKGRGGLCSWRNGTIRKAWLPEVERAAHHAYTGSVDYPVGHRRQGVARGKRDGARYAIPDGLCRGNLSATRSRCRHFRGEVDGTRTQHRRWTDTRHNLLATHYPGRSPRHGMGSLSAMARRWATTPGVTVAGVRASGSRCRPISVFLAKPYQHTVRPIPDGYIWIEPARFAHEEGGYEASGRISEADGRGIYERLGFRAVCEFTVFQGGTP